MNPSYDLAAVCSRPERSALRHKIFADIIIEILNYVDDKASLAACIKTGIAHVYHL